VSVLEYGKLAVIAVCGTNANNLAHLSLNALRTFVKIAATSVIAANLHICPRPHAGGRHFFISEPIQYSTKQIAPKNLCFANQ